MLFANYFVRVVDWSIATNDPYLIPTVSLDTCAACSGYVRKINALQSAGGYLTGGRSTVTSMKLATGTSNIPADRIVALSVTQEPAVIQLPGAQPSTESPASASTNVRVYVSWVTVGWEVVEMATDK